MKFDKALELMKKGEKVKLPSWGGYWCWDDKEQTIMMHCRPSNTDKDQGLVLDIRETQCVEYTLKNVLTEEWIIADEVNCPILGGEAMFDFGTAISYVKRGFKLKRAGWNGKNQYIELATNVSYMNPECEIVNVDHQAIGNNVIAFVGTSGVQLGWLASQADMLAEDWIFA